ncbi:hypothetical protein K3495_g13924, partial [Podosphaera aphanis]
MQNGIPGNSAVQLSEEIMKLATAYVHLEEELFKFKDDYDTLLEKNQELLDANAKFTKQKKAAGPSNSQLQQQVGNLQQQITTLQQQNTTLQQQNTSLQQQ